MGNRYAERPKYRTHQAVHSTYDEGMQYAFEMYRFYVRGSLEEKLRQLSGPYFSLDWDHGRVAALKLLLAAKED